LDGTPSRADLHSILALDSLEAADEE